METTEHELDDNMQMLMGVLLRLEEETGNEQLHAWVENVL